MISLIQDKIYLIYQKQIFKHGVPIMLDPPPLCEHCQCILTVRHILVECNHFAQERKDIFGRRDVVESFRSHPTLILMFLKQIEFYYKV